MASPVLTCCYFAINFLSWAASRSNRPIPDHFASFLLRSVKTVNLQVLFFTQREAKHRALLVTSLCPDTPAWQFIHTKLKARCVSSSWSFSSTDCSRNVAFDWFEFYKCCPLPHPIADKPFMSETDRSAGFSMPQSFFPLNHLELSSNCQSLESFQLSQVLQLPGSLFGDLRLCFFWAVISRAAAKTPKTWPAISL